MPKYKPDQGVYARTTSLWLLGALWVFGCVSLYYWLLSWRGTDTDPGWLVTPLGEGNLPVIGVPFTWSLAIATVVGLLGFLGLRRVLDKPKVADLLIDAETEMRKCTWPSWKETWGASVVTLVVMLFFTALLASMDWVLNAVITGQILR